MKKMPGKLIIGKAVIGDEGSSLGELKDIIFDEKTGKIVSIEVMPYEGSILKELYPESEKVLILFKAVKSIKDFVSVYEKELKPENIKVIE